MKLNRSNKIVLAALLAAQNFLAAAQTNSVAAPASVVTTPIIIAPMQAKPAVAASTAPPLDFAAVTKLIAQRNIFDPNRQPNRIYVPPPPRRQPQPPPPVRQINSFSLVGIIGYGEGSQAGVYAFFDGSSQQYRKTVKLNGDIANLKVADIASDSVTLASGTNKMVLKIGQQMSDSGGRWQPGAVVAVSYATGRNSGRNANGNGNGGGNRRNNNFGGGNDLGGGNNPFGRVRNGLGPNAAAADDSQIQDPNAAYPDVTPMPYNIMTPQGILTPDGTLIPLNFFDPADNSDNSDNN